MSNDPTAQLRQILVVLRRRLLLILVVAAIVTVGGTLVAMRLPDVYTASSLIRIDAGRLPKSFQQAGVVVPELSKAIGSLRQEALARDVLRALIEELEFYPGYTPGFDWSSVSVPANPIKRLLYKDPVEEARKDIAVNLVRRQGAEYVEIVVKARAPELAARAVNRMADILAAKTRDMRVRAGQDVAAFLETELLKAQQQKDEAEARTQRFRDQNREALPEHQGALYDRLHTLQARVEERRQQVGEVNARRAAIELEIGSLWKDGDAATTDSERSRLLAEIERLERADQELSRSYTQRHPERTRLRRQIDGLREQLSEAPAEGTERTTGHDGPRAHTDTGESDAVHSAAPPGSQPGQPIDGEALLSALSQRKASPRVLDAARRLVGEMTALAIRTDGLVREHEQDAQEIHRLEMVKASLGPIRLRMQNLQTELDDATKLHSEYFRDYQMTQRFLAAEEAMRGDQLRTVERAEAPLVPSGPNRLLLSAVALVAGLGLGFGLGFLLEMRIKTFRDRHEIEQELGLPILAVLPSSKGSKGPAADPDGDVEVDSAVAEQFNKLRHAVRHHPRLTDVRSIVVTSSIAGEGKTTVSLGLARAFARSLDHWAILVETDLRRPSIASRIEARPSPGVVQHLAEGLPLEQVIQKIYAKLSVICAGDASQKTAGAAHIVASSGMRQLAEELRGRYPDRIVIFDTPPVVPLPDPLSLAMLADGIVLVIEADRTPRSLVLQTVKALPAEKLLGVVVNRSNLESSEHAELVSYYFMERSENETTLELHERAKARGKGGEAGEAAGEGAAGKQRDDRQGGDRPVHPSTGSGRTVEGGAASGAVTGDRAVSGDVWADEDEEDDDPWALPADPEAERLLLARTTQVLHAPTDLESSIDESAPGDPAPLAPTTVAPAEGAGAVGQGSTEALVEQPADLTGELSRATQIFAAPASVEGEVEGEVDVEVDVEVDDKTTSALERGAGVTAARTPMGGNRARLTAIKGPGAGKVVALERPRTCLIGRSPLADMAIVDRALSRRHCVIQWRPDGCLWVEDLQSSNGVRVNGRRVPAAALYDHDTIEVGNTTFQIAAVAQAAVAVDKVDPSGDRATEHRRAPSGATRPGRLDLRGRLASDGGEQAPRFRRFSASLAFLTGPAAGARVRLDASATFTIGRSPTADILLLDQAASRQHARLRWQEDALWIEDLGSANGVRVNGRPVSRTELLPGEEIEIGQSRMRVELLDGASAG